jgi:hypothetical protein
MNVRCTDLEFISVKPITQIMQRGAEARDDFITITNLAGVGVLQNSASELRHAQHEGRKKGVWRKARERERAKINTSPSGRLPLHVTSHWSARNSRLALRGGQEKRISGPKPVTALVAAQSSHRPPSLRIIQSRIAGPKMVYESDFYTTRRTVRPALATYTHTVRLK